MNIPNLLTIGRMVLVPFFMVALLMNTQGTRLAATVIFIIASMTDWLDGYLARKNNQITNFGKIMDPLADKVLTAAAMICLVQLGDVPAWVVVLILFREYAITGLRSVAAAEGVVIAASIWGKVKTTVQMIALILLMLNPQLEVILGFNLGIIVLYVALILTLYSGLDYLLKLKNQISWS
ncbi:MAG: CDP-diacylglycerol--glycerol-3-phosphate 3-phosphatidyltransferase [Peptococcaceae bacterium]|nr:CDP-diacylglycerol--glycerol-3-phosphate 3-phosphatidyltransferase [Peptococcaceae bacterium]